MTDGRILGALCRRLAKRINAKGDIYPLPPCKVIEFEHADDMTRALSEFITYKRHIYTLKLERGHTRPHFIKVV